MKLFNPGTIAAPGSNYSHGAIFSAAAKRLVIAGQVGVSPDGMLEQGFEAQSRRAWSNLFEVLAGAGMTKHDLIRVVVYVTRPDVVDTYRAIRDEVMDGHAPPMTYLVVSGLASPDMLIEIEGEAAQQAPRQAPRRDGRTARYKPPRERKGSER